LPQSDQIVTRKLTLEKFTGPEQNDAIQQSLQIPGVRRTVPNPAKTLVTVTYDITKVRLDSIEQALSEAGWPPSSGKWARFKRGLWNIFDENACGQLTAEHRCCSKSPR